MANAHSHIGMQAVEQELNSFDYQLADGEVLMNSWSSADGPIMMLHGVQLKGVEAL